MGLSLVRGECMELNTLCDFSFHIIYIMYYIHIVHKFELKITRPEYKQRHSFHLGLTYIYILIKPNKFLMPYKVIMGLVE